MQLLIILAAKYLYLAVLAIAVVYFFIQPKEAKKRLALLVVIALPLAYMLAKLASALYFDPRPFVVGNFVPLIPHAADNGFPSDHTLLCAALAAVIYTSNKKLGLLLLLLAAFVGIARVAAGVHHPIDVVGSIAIAAAVTTAVYFLLHKFLYTYRAHPDSV